MDERTKQVIEQLKNNPGMAQALLRTQDGQNLLRLLTSGDRGAALSQAAQNAARGDTAEIVRLVSQVMQSPEGAELVERINKSVKQK